MAKKHYIFGDCAVQAELISTRPTQLHGLGGSVIVSLLPICIYVLENLSNDNQRQLLVKSDTTMIKQPYKTGKT